METKNKLQEFFVYDVFVGEDLLFKKQPHSPVGCRRARRWSRETRRIKYNIVCTELHIGYLRRNKPQIP